MTNEEMCISIKNGDNTLKSQLWDNVSKIYYWLADKFFGNNADKCTKCGLQRDDLHQLAYIAFENSIKAFDISKEYAFTSYAKYSLLSAVRSEFCKDTLNRCKSLDEIIGDEEDGQTVADLVADEDSSAPFEKIEDKSEQESIGNYLREEVSKLPNQEREVIEKRYFDNMSYDSISEEKGVSRTRVGQIHASALRHLRKPRIFCRLQDDLGYTSSRLYDRHSSVEYIATERAYLDELYKQYTEEQEDRERLANAASWNEQYEPVFTPII